MVVVPAGGFRMGCVSGRYCEQRRAGRCTRWRWRRSRLSKYEVTFGASSTAFAAATSHAPGESHVLLRLRAPGATRAGRATSIPWSCVNPGTTRRRTCGMAVSERDGAITIGCQASRNGSTLRAPGTTTPYSCGPGDRARRSLRTTATLRADDCDDGWRGTAPVGTYAAESALDCTTWRATSSEWVEDCRHPNYEGAPSRRFGVDARRRL